MSEPVADPSRIGRALPPPYAVLPDPATLFSRRSRRFEALALDHPLGAYMEVLAGVAEAQHVAHAVLPPAALPAEPARPLSRRWHASMDATLDAFFDAARAIAMPAEAAAGLETMRLADAEQRQEAADLVLAGEIPVENLVGHVFIAAALQVHFARHAATLDAARLARGGPGLCPACGGPPVASLVVGWPGAENARYCVCSLCATAWNAVRVKCTVCEATEAIGLRAVEGSDGSVKAECCDTCRCYLKVMYQVRAPGLEAVADDIASHDLDILLRDGPYRRAGFNVFLLGG